MTYKQLCQEARYNCPPPILAYFVIFIITIPWLLQEKLIPRIQAYWIARDGLKGVFRMLKRHETVWAIGFKDQVEIRLFTQGHKPRAVHTEFEKDGTRLVFEGYEDANGRYRQRRRLVPHKITLDNTIHTGGKVLKVMNSIVFWRLTHQTIPVGEVLKLKALQVAAILGKINNVNS